jgi:hypothetical protein
VGGYGTNQDRVKGNLGGWSVPGACYAPAKREAIMPNRRTHLIGGGVSGVAASLATSKGEPLGDRLVEALVAGTAGVFAGALPDVLEPATNYYHRRGAHTWAAGGLVIAGAVLLACVIQMEQQRQVQGNPVAPVALPLVVRGLLKGFPAGYVSHLALDAGTNMTLNLCNNE